MVPKRRRWRRLVETVKGSTFFETAFGAISPASEVTGPADIKAMLAQSTQPDTPENKRNLEDVRQRFAGDVAEHVVKVIKDDGLYRHIRFRRPDTSMYYFDLITWPGFLTIQGDMGGYTFRRDSDMFTFFRGSRHDADINPYYWSEKLQHGGESGRSSVMKYNPAMVMEHLKDSYDDWVAENEVTLNDVKQGEAEQEEHDAWLIRAQKVWNEVQNLRFDIETEQDAFEALREYERGENPIRLYDTWEWELRDFDYHFLWCLFAIQWGVRAYDRAPQRGEIDA